MGQYWFRQGEITETDNTKGDARKASKSINANDAFYGEELRLAA